MERIWKILEICTIKSVVDQVECHLTKNKLEFKKEVEKNKILLVAYSPIKYIDNTIKNNSDIIKIMEKYKKDIYQLY